MRHLRLALSLSLFVTPALVAQHEPPAALDIPLLLPAAPALTQLRFDDEGDAIAREPVPLDAYWGMSHAQQDMLRRSWRVSRAQPAPQMCWLTPPTPQQALLMEAAMQGGASSFQLFSRWSATATDGGGLQQGDPTTITYSFMPDGTSIPSSSLGEPVANSNLFATMNAAFPSTATWQNVFHEAFAQWSALTGITFVHEPNDDGIALLAPSSGGAIGVRGDVRLGMKFIDGPPVPGVPNTLAYNYVPDIGDMVLDDGNISLFSDPALNYRALLNVLCHELGHGVGIRHVCPVNQTKLMEPTYTSAYVGPQFDDVLAGQRHYGDDYEPNDTAAGAHDLGLLLDGLTNVTNLSMDGDADADNFRFTVQGDKLATVRMIPTGTPYLEGPQVSGTCTAGVVLDPTSLRDLYLQVMDISGTVVLATSSTGGLGNPEVISSLPISTGSYVVRITALPGNIQPYRIEVDLVDDTAGQWTPVGTDCGVNWTTTAPPIIGSTRYLVTNTFGGLALAVLGTAEFPGGLDLTPLGAPGCFAYQQAEFITPLPVFAPGLRALTLVIPNNPLLLGATVMTQAMILGTQQNALNLKFSRGIRLRFGSF